MRGPSGLHSASVKTAVRDTLLQYEKSKPVAGSVSSSDPVHPATVRAWKRNQDQNLEGISLRSLVSSCSAIFGLNSAISVRVQHLFVSLKPGLCFAWKYSSGFYSLPLLSVIFLLLLFSNKPFTLYNIFLLPDIICLLLIGCSLPSNFRSHIMPEKQPLFWRNKHHG